VGRRRHKSGKQHHWRLSSYYNVTTNTNVSVVAPTTAANVQLEASSVATPFEQRPLGLELSLGQRFCNKVNFSVLQYAASAGGLLRNMGLVPADAGHTGHNSWGGAESRLGG
jgi:hypothetical protein